MKTNCLIAFFLMGILFSGLSCGESHGKMVFDGPNSTGPDSVVVAPVADDTLAGQCRFIDFPDDFFETCPPAVRDSLARFDRALLTESGKYVVFCHQDKFGIYDLPSNRTLVPAEYAAIVPRNRTETEVGMVSVFAYVTDIEAGLIGICEANDEYMVITMKTL